MKDNKERVTSHVTGDQRISECCVRIELWADVMDFATVESRFLTEGIANQIPNPVLSRILPH